MSNRMKFVPVLIMAAAVFGASEAGAQNVAGKWAVEYPTRVRATAGGAAEAETMGQAELTLEVKGDSVSGVWQALNTPAPAKPRNVKGTFSNGRINFVSDPTEATIRRGFSGGGEEEQKIMMTTYFEGTVKDGAIDGLMYSESDDHAIKSSPLKWTAKPAAK
jgi:hypothetical protein